MGRGGCVWGEEELAGEREDWVRDEERTTLRARLSRGEELLAVTVR